jgi:hypothetical protein
MKNFFGGEKTKHIIAGLEVSSANLKKISTRINKDVSRGEIKKILLESRGIFEGTRSLVASAKKDLEASRAVSAGVQKFGADVKPLTGYC